MPKPALHALSFSLVIALIVSSCWWTSSAQQANSTLTGTVKDPNGAVVTNAQVTVRNDATGEVRNVSTDGRGAFKVEKLLPGKYTVIATRTGFKNAESVVTLEGTAAVEVKLEVAETRAEIGVAAKGAVLPNTDPNYRALRDGELKEAFEVTNLVLKRDVGTFTLKQGTVSFLPEVLGRKAMAVFVGEGEFTLKPFFGPEANYLKLVTEKPDFTESFDRVVWCFTDETYNEVKKAGKPASPDARAADLLRDYRGRLHRNTDSPRSMVEAFMTGEDVANVEAGLLAGLYNPKRAPMFSAYLWGRKHGDLRFFVHPTGAMPQMPSPEEVALINVDPQGKEEAILYLCHTEEEFKKGTANNEEDKRVVDVEHYQIETAITGEKLTAAAEIRFKSLLEGERVFRFGLLPSLRVTRVEFSGAEIPFIQEKRNDDSAFFAIMPSGTVAGQVYKIKIDYEGRKVLSDEGGGNFAVGARTSWYPSVNSFSDRATYDLTFKVPKKYTLVGVGKKVKEWAEEDFAASQWVSEVPLAVAGFNYGQFKRKELTDADTKYVIEGYATSELPGYLRGAADIGGMSPVRLLDNGMVEAQNSMRVFTHWFGPAPYGRIAITQQPQPFFGQSWPTLVYLPILSFFDSTQRWQLMGGISNGLTAFIQEVTPHEVAHQWWGHIIGWASYHDQWLSEGFADFSASLYLQATEKNLDKYLTFWRRNQESILNKNEYGKRPNDAGPIWMGLRLNTFKTQGAYNNMVYPKGGYVLHMLRWMMYDRQTGDQKFKEMMRDFVKNEFNRNVSTERFKAYVEKHMTPGMDLDGNKRMDWFFNEWVYGTEIPRYRLDYSLAEVEGKTQLIGKVTQSDVSPDFKMKVPLYLDFDGRIVRLGDANVTGNSSTPEFKINLPQRPKRVLINYHHDVLAAENTVVVGK